MLMGAHTASVHSHIHTDSNIRSHACTYRRVLTTHCTRGAAKNSFLSSLYPSMLSVFSSPPCSPFPSPLSSPPPPSPPCPPSHHCCSGPALSLVGRIQATHAHIDKHTALGNTLTIYSDAAGFKARHTHARTFTPTPTQA